MWIAIRHLLEFPALIISFKQDSCFVPWMVGFIFHNHDQCWLNLRWNFGSAAFWYYLICDTDIEQGYYLRFVCRKSLVLKNITRVHLAVKWRLRWPSLHFSGKFRVALWFWTFDSQNKNSFECLQHMMKTVVCLFKTAEEPLEWLIPEFRHLCLIQFRNDENEIAIYHVFVISM